MISKKALIFLVKGIGGGTATLSYRIGLEFQRHEYDVFYICELLNDVNNYDLLKGSDVRIVQCTENKWLAKVNDICSNYLSSIIITYNFGYFYIVNAVRKCSNVVDGYLYVVHTNGLVRGLHSSNLLIRKFGSIINKLNKNYTSKMYRNNQILFMDSLTVNFTIDNLGLCLPNVENKIFLLPYNAPAAVNIDNHKKNIIITMSRISFPFKGYILGLVDLFSKIANKYDAELWIIGDGESMPELQKKVEIVTLENRKRIKLFHNISYDRIGDILKQGKVFVGMGTSVLDAVANGLPSIPIQSYTYKCMGKGFFRDNPQCLGFEKDEVAINDVSYLIEYIFSVDDSEYKELCFENFNALKYNYSTYRFYERLIKLKNGNELMSISETINYALNKKAMSFYQLMRR